MPKNKTAARSTSYRQAVHNDRKLPCARGQSTFISTFTGESVGSQLEDAQGLANQTGETEGLSADLRSPKAEEVFVVPSTGLEAASVTTSALTEESDDSSHDSFTSDLSRKSTVIRYKVDVSPVAAAVSIHPSAGSQPTSPLDKVMTELAGRIQPTQKEESKEDTLRTYDDVPMSYENLVNEQAVYDEVPPPEEEDINANNIAKLLAESAQRLHSSQADTLNSQLSEAIYEPVEIQSEFYDEDLSDSEFESTDSQEEKEPNKLEYQPTKRSATSSTKKGREKRGKSFPFNEEKHPSPRLPDCPGELTQKQEKRRHVVASIIEIENSYVRSLDILLEYYKKPLLKSGILSAEKVETIFYKLEDILDCHFMFRIALYDRMKSWDEHEVIGSEFSEISKDFVLEVYSDFVNNFMKATELLKKSMKDKAFHEFVNAQMKASKDMVGPHGLMIKVVQRFPQYILQIKDLLKNTPTDHDDHLKLYLALSKLENVAYQLNVKKKTSEERLAARLLLGRMGKSTEMKNSDSILFRQDDVNEVSYGSNGVSKEKPRRLLLFNDMVCLISIDSRTSAQTLDKLQLKWSCPVRDVEFHENGATPNTNTLLHRASGAMLIQSSTLHQRKFSESNAANQTTALIHKELDDLMHDQTILAQIISLTSSLRQDYKGLNSDQLQEHLKNAQTSIRIRDEQLQMVDSCLICLSYIKNGHRVNDFFNMVTPERKQDWVMDFRAVKLSQESVNEHSRCWLTEEPKINYPLVIRNVDVDVTSLHTQVKCATPIFLTNTSGGIGLQYLWVCSSNESFGQVTLLSVHSNQPHIIECFQACTGQITCCALVPSNIHCSLDHVWMADSNRQVSVHCLRVGEWRQPYRKFSVPAEVMDMCCYDNHVFLALANGSVMKYAKRKGSSLYTEPASKKLSDTDGPVRALLACENNKLLAACGTTLYILSTVGDLNILERHEVQDLHHCIDKMVKLGLGIWFSCTRDPSLRLIHHETYRNISELHIGRSLCRLLPSESIDSSQVGITALTTSQGLIWVGCSTGHILTIPVPALEGIPQQSGKVNISSICHTGPVSFISTINCCITLTPQALSEEELESSTSSHSLAEDDEQDVDGIEADRGSTSSLQKRNSLSAFKTKLLDRLGGNQLKHVKNVGASTPNLAGMGLRKSPMGMYDSLMRLDDIDSPSSTTEWVNSLVPANPLPRERRCSKISTLRGNGKLRVTRSSSISDLEPSVLRPVSSRRNQVQSMWALNTTSSHSLYSEPADTDEISKAKSKAMDQAQCNVNVELRTKFGNLSRVERTERTVSVNSLLSRVAEDEELIEEADEFEASFEEKGEDNPQESANDTEENDETLIVTNFLKASLIVSGGKGFHNIHEPEHDQANSTVIMWQQNQT